MAPPIQREAATTRKRKKEELGKHRQQHESVESGVRARSVDGHMLLTLSIQTDSTVFSSRHQLTSEQQMIILRA
ncbi:hypothetical protein OUZ56_005225 [Daphnia magna]|uniref:Uncharacterized protein n=1 Tax=Daphnia magna TaxID=35525 RepID=A0ABQ9YS80_9CRUS|nr:hypothetical protein OUZ56_005225 [Daphnia magna]